MRSGRRARLKDRLNAAAFRLIYKSLPLGGFCSRHAPKIQVRELAIPCATIKQEIRLVQISDIHFDPQAGVGPENVRQVIELALAQSADAFLLTGDFIFDTCRHPEVLAALLRPLAQAGPALAIFGNHDGGRWAAGTGGNSDVSQARSILAAAGLTVLYNENTSLTFQGGVIRVVGLSDLWAGDFNPERAFAGMTDPAEPVIVLSHNPDTLEHLLPYRWDLMLSGHTHGGQVVLPFIGAPWTPVENGKYRYGRFDLSGRWLYVSAGTGGVFQLRINCPPEIVLIRLLPA